MTLRAALASDRAGNLDHLRLLAAAAVIVSHAWPLALGAGMPEPLEMLTGHSLGGWAVGLFFFLSGMLISQSAERRGAMSFWQARLLRILPGLLVALGITLVLARISGSSVGMAEAGRYLLKGVTLISLEHQLTGAFASNPYPLAVNGPLWSLPHEVLAYGLCHILVLSGLMRHRLGGVVLLCGSLLLYGLATLPDAQLLPGRLQSFAPLWLAFALGMMATRIADRLPLSPVLAVGLAASAPLGWPFAVAALGYGALVLTLRLPNLPRWGDWSFGLYIYGWPVAQTVIMVWPGLSPAALALASLAATLPFAALSWHLVERPALRLRISSSRPERALA